MIKKYFKASIKPWISTKKIHKVIEFNQKSLLKPHFYMNTKLRTEAKNDFEKYFLKLMNNVAFGKAMKM